MSGVDFDVARAVRQRLESSYFERIDDLTPMQVENWHGDRLFRFVGAGRPCLARLIAQPRVYRTSPCVVYDDALMDAQLAVSGEFVRRGLPHMRPVPSRDGDRLRTDVALANGVARLAVFAWAEGESLARVDAGQAAQIGHWLGRAHAAFESEPWPEAGLPRSHDVEVHAHWCAEVRDIAGRERGAAEALGDHLAACERHVDKMRADIEARRIVVHGDFNLPNVLWIDGGRTLGTVVDFDQIGLSRAIEDLAWVVKWYGLRGSAANPIEHLTPLIEHYAAQRPIPAEEWRCLPSLLWLSGGMNYNFVLKVLRAMEQPRAHRDASLHALAQDYRSRSERLESLGRYLVGNCSPGMPAAAPTSI